MIKIRLPEGIEAELNHTTWTCGYTIWRKLLQLHTVDASGGPSGAESDPELWVAQQAVNMFGAAIIERIAPDTSPVPDDGDQVN